MALDTEQELTAAETALAEAGRVIDTYVTKLEERIARARTFAPEQALAVEFLTAFAHLQVSPWRWSPTLRSHLSLDPGTVDALIVNMDATALAEVVEPLRWLSQRLGKYEIDDYPELGRRSYVFANDGRTVRFQVFFNSDTSTCKFVQVGVKEQPVYELKCEAEPTGARA